MDTGIEPGATVGTDGSVTRVIYVLGEPITVRTTPDGRVFVNGDEVNVISNKHTNLHKIE